MKLWRIALRYHLLNFKAEDKLWTASFKRYFLGHFVDNLDIFAIILIVYSCYILSEFASGPGQAAFPRRLLTLLLRTSNAHRCLSDYNVALALFVSVTDRPTEGGGGHELRIH